MNQGEALELELDNEGKSAFLRLSCGLAPLSTGLKKTVESLASLAADLVVGEVGTEKNFVVVGEVGKNQIDLTQALRDLETVASQIQDEMVRDRIIGVVKQVRSDLVTSQDKADLAAAGLDTGLRPAAPFNLNPRFVVEEDGDKCRVRDTTTSKVVAKGLTQQDAQDVADRKNIAIRKALGEKVGVFLRLPKELGDKLPSIKDRDPSPRHATMLQVGEIDSQKFEDVVEAVKEVAKTLEPFDVQLTDLGEFKSHKGETIAHLIPRSEGEVSLEQIHKDLREALVKVDIEPTHHPGPFKPHVTIAYLPPGERFKGKHPEESFRAETLEVWGEAGGEFGKVKIELGTGVSEELNKIEKAYRFKILKGGKEEEDEHTVFGVVLEPEEVDTQNDIYSEDEIRKTAYRFLEKYQQFGLQHNELVPTILPLESYITPVDLEINGQKVKKGTWLLRVRVLDADIWRRVKSGDLTGFSIGGTAIRTPELRMVA